MRKIDEFHLIQAVSEGRIKIKEASDDIEVVRAEVNVYLASIIETVVNQVIDELDRQRKINAELQERVREIESTNE